MKKYFLLISFLFFVSSPFSQTGTIRGFVSDKNTGEPIMFCNVIIDGTSHGSQTDLNGMYTLARIPGGEHKIVVTFIGYKKLTKEISLNKGQILTVKFELESSTVNIGEVNDPPTAYNQEIDIIEDTPYTVTLEGSDPEGEDLSFEHYILHLSLYLQIEQSFLVIL